MVKNTRNGYKRDGFVIEDEEIYLGDTDSDDETYVESESDNDSVTSTDTDSGSATTYDGEEEEEVAGQATMTPIKATPVKATPVKVPPLQAKGTPKAPKKVKLVTHVHTVVTLTPPKQRTIGGSWLRTERELVTARDERNVATGLLALAEARTGAALAKVRRLEKKLKEARKCREQKTKIRRNARGGKVLVDLKGVAINTLDENTVTILKSLWQDAYFNSKIDMASRLNIHRNSIPHILDRTIQVVQGPTKRSVDHERLLSAVKAAWAESDRPPLIDICHSLAARGYHVKERYLRKLLVKLGCVYCRPRIQQMLTALDKEKRLAFATDLLLKDDEWFKRLWFSDEKYFVVSFGQRAGWGTKGGERPAAYKVQGAPKVMIWLAIGNGLVSQAFWYEPGTMQDSGLYVQTLKLAFEPSVRGSRPKSVLQQDNAPTHSSKQTKMYTSQQNSFEVLQNWPPRSPDLNPIENLWAWLASRVRQQVDRPKNVKELQTAVNTLLCSHECGIVVTALCASFRRRLEKCVAMKGGHIGY